MRLDRQVFGGDWRLPTASEWMTRQALAVALHCREYYGGGPALLDDAGRNCYGTGWSSSFMGVYEAIFWSSESFGVNPIAAYATDLRGGMFPILKTTVYKAWPVRGGGR